MITIATAMKRTRLEASMENPVLSLRLKPEEHERWKTIILRAMQRNPNVAAYVDKSHFYRELVGLDRPYLLTPEEIAYFRGKTDALSIPSPPKAIAEKRHRGGGR